MNIFTGCWFTYRGTGRVGISQGVPKGGVPKGYLEMKKLAPTWGMVKMKDQALYRECYFRDVLSKFKPIDIHDQLMQMHGGADVVLLCWERPPWTDSNWCHRRMLSDWFEEGLGLVVDEVGADCQPKQATVQTPQGSLF